MTSAAWIDDPSLPLPDCGSPFPGYVIDVLRCGDGPVALRHHSLTGYERRDMSSVGVDFVAYGLEILRVASVSLTVGDTTLRVFRLATHQNLPPFA